MMSSSSFRPSSPPTPRRCGASPGWPACAATGWSCPATTGYRSNWSSGSARLRRSGGAELSLQVGELLEGGQRREGVQVELAELIDDRVIGWGEERELHVAAARALALDSNLRPAILAQVFLLELRQ